MKKLISMFVVLVMMFAALPISSCSNKDDYGYELDYMNDINGSWAISTLDGKPFDEFIVFKFTVAGFFFYIQ